MEDQLGVDEKTKSKKRDGYATGSCLPGGVAVGDSPFSTGGASQLILQYMDSVQTHPVYVGRLHITHGTQDQSLDTRESDARLA